MTSYDITKATAEFAAAHAALVTAEAALLAGTMTVDEYAPIWQAANDAQRRLANVDAETVDLTTATDAEVDALMGCDDDAAAVAAFQELGRREAGHGAKFRADRAAAQARRDARTW